MTVDNSETQSNVDTASTENTSADSSEVKEWGQEEQEVEQTQEKEPEKQPNQEPEKPKKSRAQERIEQTTRENAELKRQLAEYQTKQQVSEIKKPVVDTFDDFGKYESALEDYYVAQAEAKIMAKLDERESEKSKQSRQSDMESAITTFADTYADFDNVVEAGIGRGLPMPISLDEVASEFGYDSETQVRLLYELAKDQEFHEAVSDASKLRAARLLSERVDSWSNSKTPPSVSKAPKPIKPVQANAPASRNVDSLSDEEFLAQRRKNRLKG